MWERCYLLLKIIFLCLVALHLSDSSHAGMEKVYYYSRIKKQCIERKISDIYYKKIFPDINPTYNICNISDDESDEEESLSNDHTNYSSRLSLICEIIIYHI